MVNIDMPKNLAKKFTPKMGCTPQFNIVCKFIRNWCGFSINFVVDFLSRTLSIFGFSYPTVGPKISECSINHSQMFTS